MVKLITFLILSIILVSCVSKSEYEKIKTENNLLRAELKDLKESAPKLLANIKLSYDNGNFEAAKSFYSQLREKHPESDEFSEAQLIMDQIKEAVAIENKKKEEQKAAKIAELEKIEAEKNKSLNKLKKSFDDISGITWYKNPYFNHYTNSNAVSIYIGTRNIGEPWIILFMSYYADDWLFFERAYLSFDGNTKEIYFERYRDKETDNSGGKVWEWISISADDQLLKFLWKYSNGKDAKVRYVGKYSKTRTITTNEKQGIKDVLMGYMALTGKSLE